VQPDPNATHTSAEGRWRWGVGGSPQRPVMWFAGALGGHTAGSMVDVLTKALGEHPQALVIDLAGVWVEDPLALTSLITVSHRAASWPGCRVAISGASPAVMRALRGLGVHRYAPLCADPPAALALLADLGPPPAVRASLPPVLSSVAEARRLVRGACERWSLASIADHAETIVTELVTNAIVHAGTRVDVFVSRTDRMLHVAVRDGIHTMPRRTDEGYGLVLVDAYATRWRSDLTESGKVVWATLRLPRTGRPW
jgi:anti-sigma regulatory factor (Ser/Thr protein kinase)/anti-anti-sigma regulatory factor